MSNLEKWENKVKEKKRNSSFKWFLKDIVSFWPINFHKRDWVVSRYPLSPRMSKITTNDEFFSLVESSSTESDYNFSMNFWKNFKKVSEVIPFPNLIHISAENSVYADTVWWSKNAYLSFVVMESENVLYSYWVKDNSRNVLNSVTVNKQSENIFSSFWISTSQNIFYSRYINNSSEIWFSDNLISCQECLFCNNLENASYSINNEELSKEDYFKQKKIILSKKEDFHLWQGNVWNRWKNIWSEKVNGNMVVNSKNIENGLYVQNVINWKNLIMVWWNWTFKNCYDVFDSWTGNDSHDLYWLSGWWMGNNQYNCITSLWSYLYYCNFCWDCFFCLGCIWLKNKSYYILNKQYTKEEWYVLADKIFAQMESDGILWDFFPWELNPFYFNDTMACIINDKFTKEEVTKDWYMWIDEEINVDVPEWAEVVNIEDLDIVNYDESILQKVIKDKKWNYYRIVKMEYDFLKKHNLPLPEIHWLDRIKLGFNFS